jgi:hypothetical protein
MTDDWDTPWSNPHPIWHRHVGVTLGPISQNAKKYKKGLKSGRMYFKWGSFEEFLVN